MRAFSKPKQLKKKLEVGKGSAREVVEAEIRTRRKYPQMYKEGWGDYKATKKTTPPAKKKKSPNGMTTAQNTVSADDAAAIMKMSDAAKRDWRKNR
jgi:hypothetical protein